MIFRHSGMIRAYDAIDVPQEVTNEAGASTPAVTHETVQGYRNCIRRWSAATFIYRWVCPVQIFRQGFKEIGLDYDRQVQEREM
jgi:hypothetical protein